MVEFGNNCSLLGLQHENEYKSLSIVFVWKATGTSLSDGSF